MKAKAQWRLHRRSRLAEPRPFDLEAPFVRPIVLMKMHLASTSTYINIPFPLTVDDDGE